MVPRADPAGTAARHHHAFGDGGQQGFLCPRSIARGDQGVASSWIACEPMLVEVLLHALLQGESRDEGARDESHKDASS